MEMLSQVCFDGSAPGWALPGEGFEAGTDGAVLAGSGERGVTLNGFGVHTRNGDAIALVFQVLEPGKGRLRFGFSGGMESAVATLDFETQRVSLSTSDWTCPQPVQVADFRLAGEESHTLRLEKTEGRGGLVQPADLAVFLDGERVLSATGLNVLPEMGVTVGVTGTRVQVLRFVHSGRPQEIPEYLHVGGWQMLNRPSIEENLGSLFEGLEQAAERGVQLLVTPETSLTGLFPTHPVTQDPGPVAGAEDRVRRFLRGLSNAPYLVLGMPVWESIPGHELEKTRYNVSRVYDPDGEVVGTYPKIHSCESYFWHGYRLHEFDVYGVPVCMHICHDGRYPEVWTLPVMFGARLALHPSNGGRVSGSIDAFERGAGRSTSTSHAFYVNVNGGGGSYITSPHKFDNVLAVSAECRREARSFPMAGPPQACLLEAKLRVHDAFGYWPVRSFRASEEGAQAYAALYRARGGRRLEAAGEGAVQAALAR